MPQPDRKGGERRAADLIDLLREHGFAVTLAVHGEGEQRYAEVLRGAGLTVLTGVGAEIEAVAARRHFELALLCFWPVAEAWLPGLRALSPDTKVFVDSVDLHFVREARAAFAAGGPGRLDRKYGVRYARELTTYAAADRVLTVSDKEARLVNDLTGSPRLAIAVPDFAAVSPSSLGFEDRDGIVLVGNFDHAPNVDALEFLLREVVPRLSADLRAQHPVRVVGHALDDSLVARCRTAGLEPVGWVPSVEAQLARARVSVVPLRFGAGTKRKVIEALTVGTPTVTTSIGAEGLPISDGSEVLVADDADGFARAVEALLSDEALWARLATAGRAQMAEHHSRERAAALLREAIETTSSHPVRPARAG